MTIQVEDIVTDVSLLCPCGQPAKLIALRHLIDTCTGTLAGTPDGDEVHPVCVNCARLLHQSVASDLEARIYALPDGDALSCHTCSRPITAIHSVLEWTRI